MRGTRTTGWAGQTTCRADAGRGWGCGVVWWCRQVLVSPGLEGCLAKCLSVAGQVSPGLEGCLAKVSGR